MTPLEWNWHPGRGRSIYLIGLLVLVALSIVGRNAPDIDLFVLYGLVALSFPSGYLFTWVVGGIAWFLSKYFGITIPGGLVGNLVLAVAFGAIGYAQWTGLAAWRDGKNGNAI